MLFGRVFLVAYASKSMHVAIPSHDKRIHRVHVSQGLQSIYLSSSIYHLRCLWAEVNQTIDSRTQGIGNALCAIHCRCVSPEVKFLTPLCAIAH